MRFAYWASAQTDQRPAFARASGLRALFPSRQDPCKKMRSFQIPRAWRRSRRFALPSLRSKAKNVFLNFVPRRPETANDSPKERADSFLRSRAGSSSLRARTDSYHLRARAISQEITAPKERAETLQRSRAVNSDLIRKRKYGSSISLLYEV